MHVCVCFGFRPPFVGAIEINILPKISFRRNEINIANENTFASTAQTIRRVRMADWLECVCMARAFTRSITLFPSLSLSHSLAGNSFLERGDNDLCRASDDGFALI